MHCMMGTPVCGQLRDWSLITGRGGSYKTGGGGACEVLPLQKGGGGIFFSHAEGGGGAQQVLREFEHGSLKF